MSIDPKREGLSLIQSQIEGNKKLLCKDAGAIVMGATGVQVAKIKMPGALDCQNCILPAKALNIGRAAPGTPVVGAPCAAVPGALGLSAAASAVRTASSAIVLRRGMAWANTQLLRAQRLHVHVVGCLGTQRTEISSGILP
jgi:hypothetical protein